MSGLVGRSSAEWKREAARLEADNARLRRALEVIVHGATGTMGTDSGGYEYARVRQVMLNVGRAALSEPEIQAA
jgi:hypothetical protein